MRRLLRTLVDQFRAKAAIRRRRANEAIHRRILGVVAGAFAVGYEVCSHAHDTRVPNLLGLGTERVAREKRVRCSAVWVFGLAK